MSNTPVIMYHTVGIENPAWIWHHLITPVKVFEDQIKALSEGGYSTITLHELYDHIKYNKNIPEKSVVLTFDDGYLDNWVFAYPLLRKHGFKGTIYVNPEFVDPRNIVRKNLYDVWDSKENIEKLETRGFLSWEEMKIMEHEGVMDIQSHSMSHTWYFTGNEIVDFHYPGNNQHPWLFWNAQPDRKSYYLNENQETFVPYGTPIYNNGRSLGIKRYFEDEGLNKRIVDYVKEQGPEFFTKNNWKDILFKQVEGYKSENKLKDRYESDKEQEERYRYELIESKKLLEDKLKKKVQFLCWAGGALNDLALSIAKEAGYLSSTLFFNDMKRKNTYGEDPSVVNRTGCVSEFVWQGKFITYTTPDYFIANIKYFCGNMICLWVIRLYKVKYLIGYFFKKALKRGDLR